MSHAIHISVSWPKYRYGVALVSSIDKIIGLFCKRALQKSQYSAKETYNLIDSTIRSHPMKDRETHQLKEMCLYESHPTYERVMSRIWMSHGTHIRVSWPTYRYESATHIKTAVNVFIWVMSHMWMIHGTHLMCHDPNPDKRSRRTSNEVTVSNQENGIYESCPTWQWVMSHL